ncbi:MAG: ATP synthase F1 subunit delta [Nitrospirae bacterium]|nr:ATP synthase F1 subunit delta [Nitrospirota bacterium]
MKPAKEAKKYAKTLINVVSIDGMPQALAELAAIENMMLKSSDFKSLLLNPAFSQSDREKALKQMAESAGFSEKVVRFVMHLSEFRIIAALSEIIKIATAIYLEKKGRAKATVLTSIEMSKDYEERLKRSLNKLTERDVDIEFVMEPALLGGILVKVGSTMYDTSIKGQLRLLKNELIKG